jgi:23S rRNA (cytosine1962-C5)-methyltransferase
MPSASKRRGQPDRQNLLGETQGDDASAHRQHVGVVVLARQPGSVQIVAQGRADAGHLIGGDLLALSAAAEHDAAVRTAFGDRASDGETDRRVVDHRLAVRAVVGHVVAEPCERPLEVFLEKESGVISANRDAHGRRLYYWRTKRVIPTVTISSRGEERLKSGHPWIYRSDLVDVRASGGDRVVVRGPRGRTLGDALFSDRSQIALRVLARGDGPPDPRLIRDRLTRAVGFRESLRIDATACRLVHGEGDLLPSLVVDRYGEYLVVQALSQGMDRLLPDVVAALGELTAPRGILARNDPRARALEGLEQRVEVLAGEIPETVRVTENEVHYDVDLRRGQKTGLFLDQRENRSAAAQYASGRLLDCFSYHGGFALALAPRCRETLAIDISEDAVARLRANAAANGLQVDARAGNVFDELRAFDRSGERFDTIVLDPPAFAKNKAAVGQALGGYKEINLRALKLLNPGGTLVTCSCSYHVNEAMFAEIVYEAAVDAQIDLAVVDKRMQGRDHPVLLGVPETYYLKCFILRKLA